MKESIVEIGQIWVSKTSWGDIDGLIETSDNDKIKRKIISIDGDIISYSIKEENRVLKTTRSEFLKEFKQFPFVDITPEEIIERLNKSVAEQDFPYSKKEHIESLWAIQAQIATNDNKPLYCVGFDNGRHFKIVSVYFQNLEFIMKNFSDGSNKPNVNRLNEDHKEKIEEMKLRIENRRPMWFKPYTVKTRPYFENGQWFPESERLVDWDSPEGDKIKKGSQILKIWEWENTLGFYKIFRITSPVKIEPFI